MNNAKKQNSRPLPDLKSATAEILNKTAKRKITRVVPDVKSVTRLALGNIADYAERLLGPDVIFGIPHERRTTREEWAVFEEAKQLAINYIRLGAKQ